MEIIGYISILIALLYTILIVVFTISWFKIPQFNCIPKNPEDQRTNFSILIPFRNEEINLPKLFNDLEAQNYPNSLFEVILIDDESNDNSNKTARNIIASSKLQCKLLNSRNGKKKALQLGLKQASGDFIITFDADVRIEINHLECFHQFYKKTKAKLIAGPITFSHNNSLLSRILSLEFTSLITSGAAAMHIGKPIMLNAANMGFERKIALEFQSEVYQSGIASGDDQFLMEAIEREYGSKCIHFLKSKAAIAVTKPPENIQSFINQRIRWASKTSAYKSRFSQFVALLILLFNFSLILNIGFSIYLNSALPFLILFALKFIIDLPILLNATVFFKQGYLLLYYPLIQLIYPWYIVGIAIMSFFPKYNWKGRNIG